ncbi:MAG: sialidase family protein [Candidatus Saliniplasma sp.]
MTSIKISKFLAIVLVMLIIFPFNTIANQNDDKEINFSEPKEVQGGLYTSGEGDDDDICLFGQHMIARSNDKGHNWSYDVLEGDYESCESYSRFDIENGIIYRIMWCRDLDENQEEIFFLRSEDRGDSWSDPIKISSLKGTSDGFIGINVIQDYIFVYFWDQDPHTNTADVIVARSTDGGETWSSAKACSKIAMTDPLPNNIVYKDGKLYLTCYTSLRNIEDIKTIIAVSDDMGETWEKNVIDKGGFNPIIGVGRNYLYLTFLRMDGIYFTRSVNGEDWSTPVKIGEFIDHTDPTIFHSMVVKSNLIFVSYLQYEVVEGTKIYELKMKYSKDHGVTWHSIDSPTGLEGNSMSPILFINDDILYFSWTFTGEGGWTTNRYTTYTRSADISDLQTTENGSQDSPGYPITVIIFSIGVSFILIKWRRYSMRKKSS